MAGTFISTNWGATWADSDAPTGDPWGAVVSSADGSKVLAVRTSSLVELYTLQTTPTPSLAITPSSTNALLSWTIPSTDFTLEQNSDLTTTNWTDVPTPPVLNLTNLQNQVIVVPTNCNTFFRLKH